MPAVVEDHRQATIEDTSCAGAPHPATEPKPRVTPHAHACSTTRDTAGRSTAGNGRTPNRGGAHGASERGRQRTLGSAPPGIGTRELGYLVTAILRHRGGAQSHVPSGIVAPPTPTPGAGIAAQNRPITAAPAPQTGICGSRTAICGSADRIAAGGAEPYDCACHTAEPPIAARTLLLKRRLTGASGVSLPTFGSHAGPEAIAVADRNPRAASVTVPMNDR
jgi:hypothetical protein